MPLIEPSKNLTVGYDLIDRDHDEFITLLNQLDTASNADFPALFQQLQVHTEQHFERENQLMQQFSYPGELEHKSEHQRVLAEFKQFRTRVDKGMITFGRSFVRERLPQWFGLHVTNMDIALVMYLNANFPAK